MVFRKRARLEILKNGHGHARGHVYEKPLGLNLVLHY